MTWFAVFRVEVLFLTDYCAVPEQEQRAGMSHLYRHFLLPLSPLLVAPEAIPALISRRYSCESDEKIEGACLLFRLCFFTWVDFDRRKSLTGSEAPRKKILAS